VENACQYKVGQAISGQFEIGRNAPRLDALNKVTGQEKYAADYYPDNFAWIGVKRSEHAHAYIKHIDTAAAGKVPGVVAVLTHKDIKGSNRLGIFEKDQPILANDKVRHLGDAVALVIAETQAALVQGLAAVVVAYEPITAVFAVNAALKPDAPLLHEGRSDGNNSGSQCLGVTQSAYCRFHTESWQYGSASKRNCNRG
jgi:CO/xanthine dehydrogenase Mo-binding subunit